MNQISNYNQELSCRLQQDITKYQEANQIFSKLDYVGYINQIYDLFYNIYYSEYQFTVQELKKLQKEEYERFDFIEKYQINSLIFKSNFQVICNSINDYLWVLFFNKAQSEFQQDHSISIIKSEFQNSDEKQKLKQDFQQFTPDNIRLNDFQVSEKDLSSNLINMKFDLSNQQYHVNKQENKQIEKDSNASIIREEIMKMKEKVNQQKQITTKYDNITLQQREDIVKESFIEDQQDKLNKYLNYENDKQSNQAMSVMNLQKNLEWIVKNYPDLDKALSQGPSKKESLELDNLSRLRFDSLDRVVSSETEIQQIKLVTELLNGQKKQDVPLSLQGMYQENKALHFEKKFSTVKPHDFQAKLALAQQLNSERQSYSQGTSSQKFGSKTTRESQIQQNSVNKEQQFQKQNQPIEVQKLFLQNSGANLHINLSKKNQVENVFYCDDSDIANNKIKKKNIVTGSYSTKHTQSTTSGKRSPSFAFSKTPKVSLFDQQVKQVETMQKNLKFN